MAAIRNINSDTFWIGVNDRVTSLFEGIWPLPRGVSYNSYIIRDEKTALMDTVKGVAPSEYLKKIERVVGEHGGLDYLVIHHMEPDHSGLVTALRKIYPEMQIIGTKKAADYLSKLYGVTEGVRAVGSGEEISLGKHKLRFIPTPMVHWPETMMSYDLKDKTLYSGDAFGGFAALEGGIFDDELGVDYYEDEILRYFSNIIGKYSKIVKKTIEKLRDVEVKTVAPTHGLVWRKRPQHIIDLYYRWSCQKGEQGAVMAYGSMYGNTERMAEAVAEGLRQHGTDRLVVHDLSRSHLSFVIRDIWRYKGLVLGSPTYDTGVFPPVYNLISFLSEKMIKNKVAGVFGTFGWSGGAVKKLKEFTRERDLQLAEPQIEANFRATDEQLDACRKLGKVVAENIKQSAD